MYKRLIGILSVLAMFISAQGIDAQLNPTVKDTAWNADGTRLAVARGNGTLDILDENGVSLVTFEISFDPLLTVDWNPMTENQIAVGTRYGAIFVLDLDIDDKEFTVAHQLSVQFTVHEIAFNSDGGYLAAEGDAEPQGSLSTVSMMQIWDTTTWEVVNTYSDDWYLITDIVWSPHDPNEMLIAAIERRGGNRIMRWNPITDVTLWIRDSDTERFTGLAWSPDGTRFASSTIVEGFAMFQVHHAATGESMVTLPNFETLYGGNVIWEPGNHLLIDSTKIHIWDTTSFERIAVIDEFPSELALSPTGQLAYGKATGGDYSSLFTQDLNTVIPNYPSITSLTLVDADADEDLRLLEDGDIITEETITIRVETEPPIVGSVVFRLDDEPRFKVENEAAYALKGDDNGDYHAWLAEPGTYTLTATPYTEADGGGEAGTPLTITFTVAEPGS